jgi:XisI protein/XisH protein
VSAKDIFHDIVKAALEREQWIITHDPLRLKFGDVNFQGNCRMDKVEKYRESVRELITRYASEDSSSQDVDVELVVDVQHDHYQWMNVGWEGLNRVYRCIVHLDIKDGKVWLQQNLTDRNPAEELVEMGVAREDIVLGLHPPYKRPYTDYGVA